MIEMFNFKVLVYPWEDKWVIHCLELDLVHVVDQHGADEVGNEQ